MAIHPVIANVCLRADAILWDAYDAGTIGKSAPFRTGRLLFPLIRGGQPDDLRVSEQEARFAFLESVVQAGLNYAVEVPTEQAYQFTGTVGQSAQTDLVVYDANGVERICNVEFKAKGVSTNAVNQNHIYKDFEKLFRERPAGVWYHVLESVNNSTINELINVINYQIDAVHGNFPQNISTSDLALHFCVLRHGFSVHVEAGTHVKPVLPQLNITVTRDSLQQVTALNGWTLTRRPRP